MNDIFSCNIYNLPTEALIPKSFSFDKMAWLSEYRQCLRTHVHKEVLVQDCSSLIAMHCPKHVQTSMNHQCDIFIEMVRRNDSILYRQSFDESDQHATKYEAFQKHYKCVLHARQAIQPCVPLLKKSCEKTKIRSAKILRLDLSTVRDIIERDPDVKVIYSVRDPRGILLSTTHVMLMAKNSMGSLESEAVALCIKMYNDIQEFKEIVKKYPNNIHAIKYEEIAVDPMTAVRNVYNFTGIAFHSEVERTFLDLTHNEQSGSAFSQIRKNSTKTSKAWEQELGEEQKKIIDQACHTVLELAKYS